MKRKSRRAELIFLDALKAFLAAEGNTLLTGVSERNTCQRLSIYLDRQIALDGLQGYYADAEYNRKQDNKVKTVINDKMQVIKITADLIVHTRGEKLPPDDNLIAVEMKKASQPERGKEDDRDRLRAMTKVPFEGVWPWEGGHPEHVCGYEVGIFADIDSTNRTLRLEFYKKGELTKRKEIAF